MQEAYEAVWDAIIPITAASKNFLSLEWRSLTEYREKSWYVFGLVRRCSTIGFILLCHTVELAMSTRLCSL